MAYNQPLALGLAIGIPCFLVLVACTFLVHRRRRIQKREDKAQDDVELGDNESFKGFEQALHQPQVNKSAANDHASAEKASVSLDINRSGTHSPSSSHLHASFAAAEDTTESPFESSSSVVNPSASNTAVNIVPKGRNTPRDHNKSSSVYDFYDSFIPIAQPDERFSRNSALAPVADLQQPPAITSDRVSIQSHSNSLIGPTRLDRSLDNLAKQLHGHQFAEKFPTQRGVINGSPKRLGSVNDSLSEAWSPSKEAKLASEKGLHTVHPYRAQAVEGKPSLGLQDNFDNNITADADFDDTPAVVFK